MDDETSPLLGNTFVQGGDDPHKQFCMLIGIPPSDLPKGSKLITNPAGTLYDRARATHEAQNRAYIFTATLTNTLLLAQVVLGAALTGLGASNSSHVLITLFGASNTIIAGLITYLKSRGQPMRARMYRDDLEGVVGEIQNSEIMWLGISKGIHGYGDIDADKVSVRSEVARLTRLYERAVKNNNENNPDLYTPGSSAEPTSGLKAHPPPPAAEVQVSNAPDPAPAPANGTSSATAPAALIDGAASVDDSPATEPAKPANDKKADATKSDSQTPGKAPDPSTAPGAAKTPAPAPVDPDASPATDPVVAPKSKGSASNGDVVGKT